MITNMAELLSKLKEHEVKILDSFDIKHPTIIGDMYEGLTKSILQKVIFKDIDLRIVDGKIRNDIGDLSNQIDIMLVIGEGLKVPHTEHYIYPPEQVIAVFEIKKNLYANDLIDSYGKLLKVKNIFIKPKELQSISILRQSFEKLAKMQFPESNEILITYPIEIQYLYHYLVTEAHLPLRIIFGYHGFKRHKNFRDSFVSFLEKNKSDKENIYGFGPASFPNLIICDNYSLLKTNGFPYQSKANNRNNFPLMVSSSDNPIYYLIEILWTKINMYFHLPNWVWGDDLEIESFYEFINTKLNNSNNGWDYEIINLSETQLEQKMDIELWKPLVVTEDIFTIYNNLINTGVIDITNKSIIDDIVSEHPSVTKDELLKELVGQGFVSITDNKIVLITENLICVIMPKDEYIVCENTGERFSKWYNKNYN